MVREIIGSFIFISLLIIIGNAIYTRETFRVRMISGKIDLLQLLYLIFLPLVFVALYFIFVNIISNPYVGNIPFNDKTASFFLLLFITLSATGSGMHAASKTVSNYLRKSDNQKAYEVNEFFHIPLSHFLTYTGIMLISITMILSEMNHPAAVPLTGAEIIISLLAGALLGISFGMIIFHANVTNIYLPLSFLALIGTLVMLNSLRLDIFHLPATIYSGSEILFLFISSIGIHYYKKRTKKTFLVKL